MPGCRRIAGLANASSGFVIWLETMFMAGVYTKVYTDVYTDVMQTFSFNFI